MHRAIWKADSKGRVGHTWRMARRTPDADTEENRPWDAQGDSRQPWTDREGDND
jgi:hypothetical protein